MALGTAGHNLREDDRNTFAFVRSSCGAHRLYEAKFSNAPWLEVFKSLTSAVGLKYFLNFFNVNEVIARVITGPI